MGNSTLACCCEYWGIPSISIRCLSWQRAIFVVAVRCLLALHGGPCRQISKGCTAMPLRSLGHVKGSDASK